MLFLALHKKVAWATWSVLEPVLVIGKRPFSKILLLDILYVSYFITFYMILEWTFCEPDLRTAPIVPWEDWRRRPFDHYFITPKKSVLITEVFLLLLSIHRKSYIAAATPKFWATCNILLSIFNKHCCVDCVFSYYNIYIYISIFRGGNL